MQTIPAGLIALLLLACTFAVTAKADAQDWGAYSLVPSGSVSFVLEAVKSGTADGTSVSLGKPAGTPNQKWFVVPKGDNFYAIKPSYSSTLVLAASQGGTNSGTAAVLETDQNQPWQQWALRPNEGGTYTLVPRHAPDKGLDHFGGVQKAGAQIDIWTNTPGDSHLQWFIKPLAGSMVPNLTPETTYIPPNIKPEGVPRGAVKTFSFAQSYIFPGTVRDVTVFVPAQYDGSKPACVYVKTDGYSPQEKDLLETMIATQEMPITVGVFVQPGEVPAPIEGTLGRRNRSYEYDGLGDSNARFFVEELLPFVAKQFNLKLSTNGNDRCIVGGSSGGITAFNAAWERPDAFSRVYASSGSFVAFRGGHELPTLVRKFEAKPIRVYMTTGTHDMENSAGDWFLLDQEMDKALKFSNYDSFFRIVNGGHVAGYSTYWREAMSFLWKGWPQPVQAGASAPRVRDILLPDEKWQLVAEKRYEARGATSNATGEVFFTEGNSIYRIDQEDKIGAFVADAGDPNSLSFGPQGQLYSVSSQTGKIISYDANGKGHPVAEGIRGQSVLALPKGGLYVTAQGKGGGEVWFVKEGQKRLVDSGLKRATGLAYRPDQWLLSVADGGTKWAYSYQMNPDGSLQNKERFFWLHVPDEEDDAGAESVCYAREGQMFVATRLGIQVCADEGATQVILPLPDRSRVLSVCLGGKNGDTLYAFSGDKIWKRKVKVHVVSAFTPWVKVNGSPL